MENMIIMPEIMRETSSGHIKYGMGTELFRNREILCFGPITQKLAASLILQLRCLHRQDAGKEITMYINSGGGEITSGLAVYDMMKTISCPIRTVCVGRAASMAAVIFMSGSQRDILPHASVLIHDPLIPETGGNALQLERINRELMKSREIIGKIISEHTGKSIKEVFKKTSAETCFSAEESVAWGIADRVIRELEVD